MDGLFDNRSDFFCPTGNQAGNSTKASLEGQDFRKA